MDSKLSNLPALYSRAGLWRIVSRLEMFRLEMLKLEMLRLEMLRLETSSWEMLRLAEWNGPSRPPYEPVNYGWSCKDVVLSSMDIIDSSTLRVYNIHVSSNNSSCIAMCICFPSAISTPCTVSSCDISVDLTL